jgi:hypothetical protein
LKDRVAEHYQVDQGQVLSKFDEQLLRHRGAKFIDLADLGFCWCNVAPHTGASASLVWVQHADVFGSLRRNG